MTRLTPPSGLPEPTCLRASGGWLKMPGLGTLLFSTTQVQCQASGFYCADILSKGVLLLPFVLDAADFVLCSLLAASSSSQSAGTVSSNQR